MSRNGILNGKPQVLAFRALLVDGMLLPRDKFAAFPLSEFFLSPSCFEAHFCDIEACGRAGVYGGPADLLDGPCFFYLSRQIKVILLCVHLQSETIVAVLANYMTVVITLSCEYQ